MKLWLGAALVFGWGGLGCEPPTPEPVDDETCRAASELEPCNNGAVLRVRGDLVPAPGPVALSASVDGTRATLVVTDERGATHTAEFAVDDGAFDETFGAVNARFGGTILGEGSETLYLRIDDERGLLFAGGRTLSFDEQGGGGAQVESPFSRGEVALGCCQSGFGGATRSGVRVQFIGASRMNI